MWCIVLFRAWILGMMMSHDKAKAREAALALSILQVGIIIMVL